MRIIKNREGFAMIAALLAILILTAVGVLVFTVTTRDIRISARVTGEKKAFSATEAGVHLLIQQTNILQGNIAGYTVSPAQPVNTLNDTDTRYSITNANPPSGVPAAAAYPGYSLSSAGGSQSWGMTIFNKRVTGINTRYNSNVDVDVGIGYGPVEISTSQPAAGG
ncbi:MAG: hypothetical protein ACOYW7_15160 [Nitrospirota bacterium]